MNRPEQQLQRAALDLLRLLLGDRYMVLHVPNGGVRSRVEAAILKGLGVRAGAADLLIVRGGFVAWLELKAEGGRLSPAQREFRADCEAKGIPWAEARSLDEVHDVVAWWGLCRPRAGRRARA